MNQAEILYPLLIGITSSLVATAIFVALAEIIRRFTLPWIADKIYRGVRIDGEWNICELSGIPVEDKNIVEMKFNLIQKGEKITGTYFHIDEGEKTLYKVNGILKNMYFMAIMQPISNKVIDASSFLLHVNYSDGTLLLIGSALSKNKPGEVTAIEGLVFTQTPNKSSKKDAQKTRASS